MIGNVKGNSLVWKAGMAEWVKAESVEELKKMFVEIPPVPVE